MIYQPENKASISLKHLFRKLFPFFQPYRWHFILGFAFILLSTSAEIVRPLLVGEIVDRTIKPNAQIQDILNLCFGFFILIVLRFVFDSAKSFLIQATGQKLTHDLRSYLFARIENLPVSYFDKNPVGRPLTRVVNDIKSLGELFTAAISVLALDIFLILGTVLAMFWLDVNLALVITLTLPPLFFAVRFFGNRLAIRYREVRAKLSEINAFLGENIGAIATIQRLSAEKARLSSFQKIVDAHFDRQMRSLRLFALVQPTANTFNGIATGGLVIFGGYWVIQGNISLGVLVAFFGYIRNLFVPVRDVVEKYNQLLSARISAERIVDLLDEPTEADNWEPFTFEQKSDTYLFSHQDQKLDIRFTNVTFSYPTRELPALENISFYLPAGTSTALVGATGSGKSTIVRLLLRFYELQQGNIEIGGRFLHSIARPELRKKIGVVHQETYLFEGKLRNNLTLGQSGFSDDYLIEQLKKAQIWDAFRSRGGLEMTVYERGTNFSIGEKQLISFARILTFNPPLLILDEATASIDRSMENRLMEAIGQLLLTRTSLLIAHRLSTIRRCDNILVLERGQLVEEGPHSDLVQRNGPYQRFHEIHAGA